MAYSLITMQQSKSPVAEAFRTLRTNIQFTGVDSETKKIMITSAGPREGKSSTAANLAVSFAQAGKTVVVIDADLRNPSQHKLFGLDNRKGLSTALLQDPDEEGLKFFLRETGVPGVSILTGGPIPPNPAELLGSKRMKGLLELLGSQFDIVIVDTPPVIAVTDAAIISQIVDGVILVLASGEVNRDFALRGKELLAQVGAKILGVVLNKVDIKTSDYYYYYYYSSSGNEKHKKAKKQKRPRRRSEKTSDRQVTVSLGNRSMSS